MLAAGSFVAFAIVVAAMVRSYWVMDGVSREHATKEPLTPAAERYAARNGFVPEYVRARCGVVGQAVARSHCHLALRARDVVRAFEEPFEKRFSASRRGGASEARSSPRLTGGTPHGLDAWVLQASISPRRGVFYNEFRRVTVPLWSVALMTAIAPLAWLKRALRQWRRRRRGRCVVCGYDLRAQPEEGDARNAGRFRNRRCRITRGRGGCRCGVEFAEGGVPTGSSWGILTSEATIEEISRSDPGGGARRCAALCPGVK
jgi:hypothetical protein